MSQSGAVLSYLTDRSVISVRGPKSTEFLQKLTTQDMRLFDKDQNRACIFTGFLNVKGRLLFDAMIVKPKLAGQAEEPEYWLDVHEKDAD